LPASGDSQNTSEVEEGALNLALSWRRRAEKEAGFKREDRQSLDPKPADATSGAQRA